MATYTKLIREMTDRPQEASVALKEAFDKKQITTRDFELGRLFFECFGYDGRDTLRGGGSMHRVYEAAGAVTTAAFQNITNNFISAAILEGYALPTAEFSKLIPIEKTTQKFERLRGLTNIGDEFPDIEEGKDYPEVGFTEDWQDTPDVRKHGGIVSLTREAILFDQTNQIVAKARTVGSELANKMERMAIECVTDASSLLGPHRYKWQGTEFATYGDAVGARNWDNLVASNALADYTDLNAAWQQLMLQVDPVTGRPAWFEPKHLVVPPGLAIIAHQALYGEARLAVGGFPTSGNPVQTTYDKPYVSVMGDVQVVGFKNRQLAQIQGDDTTWYLGDLTKAFVYKEALPLTVTEEGENGARAFQSDVVLRFKASMMGTYATIQPRAVIKCTA